MTPVKTLNDMRAMIFQEVANMQEGKSTPQKLNAMVGAFGFVLNSVKVQLEYAKALSKKPGMEFFEVLIADEQPKELGQ